MVYEYKCTNCTEFFEQPNNSICSFIYQCFKNNLEGLGLEHNFYNRYF